MNLAIQLINYFSCEQSLKWGNHECWQAYLYRENRLLHLFVYSL